MEDTQIVDLFHEELIDLACNAQDKETFFESRFNILLNKGYVKKSFKEAIVERETKFPTGLKLEYINLAIPHTDTIHIHEPFVYINRVNHDIVFNQMGDEQETVAIRDVWVLGIKDPSKQVSLLAFIMELFSKKEFVERYQSIQDSHELLKLIGEYI